MRVDWLNSPELVVFNTRDFARAADVSVAAATRRLTRIARRSENGFLRLTRGVWANTRHPYFTVFACVPVLLGNEQGYVSFLSALHAHGAIAQIPASIQVATYAGNTAIAAVMFTACPELWPSPWPGAPSIIGAW